jgi:hypothetical protein
MGGLIGDLFDFLRHLVLATGVLLAFGVLIGWLANIVFGPVLPSPAPAPRHFLSEPTQEEIRAEIRAGCTHLDATPTQSGGYRCRDCGLNAVRPGQRGPYQQPY